MSEDSQVGPHGELTDHLEPTQPTMPAGRIQYNQPKNTELLRVGLQGAPSST